MKSLSMMITEAFTVPEITPAGLVNEAISELSRPTTMVLNKIANHFYQNYRVADAKSNKYASFYSFTNRNTQNALPTMNAYVKSLSSVLHDVDITDANDVLSKIDKDLLSNGWVVSATTSNPYRANEKSPTLTKWYTFKESVDANELTSLTTNVNFLIIAGTTSVDDKSAANVVVTIYAPTTTAYLKS